MKRAWLLTAALVASCGSDTKTADSDAGTEDDAGTPREPNGKRCTYANALGGFRIAPAKGFANISGQISSAVVPSVEYTLVGEADGCQLVQKKNPFCDPPCSGGDVCTPSGSCEPEAHSLDLGTVHVTGLSQPVRMEPAQPGHNYFDTDVPEDGVPVGAAIRLFSDGGELDAVELVGRGPSPLEVTSQSVRVERGKPVELTWKVPSEGTGNMRITLNVDQHGNSPISLTCDVADDGSHAIPSALIDQLLGAGVSGFPTAFLARESLDAITLDEGCVDLVVRYQVQRAVDVVGHTPCRSNQECDEGQHCDLGTESCVDD